MIGSARFCKTHPLLSICHSRSLISEWPCRPFPICENSVNPRDTRPIPILCWAAATARRRSKAECSRVTMRQFSIGLCHVSRGLGLGPVNLRRHNLWDTLLLLQVDVLPKITCPMATKAPQREMGTQLLGWANMCDRGGTRELMSY